MKLVLKFYFCFQGYDVVYFGRDTLLTYFLTYLISYLLTPWSTVLLEKLNGFQLVKIFPTFYGTRKFIAEFTSICVNIS